MHVAAYVWMLIVYILQAIDHVFFYFGAVSNIITDNRTIKNVIGDLTPKSDYFSLWTLYGSHTLFIP